MLRDLELAISTCKIYPRVSKQTAASKDIRQLKDIIKMMIPDAIELAEGKDVMKVMRKLSSSFTKMLGKDNMTKELAKGEL